MRCIIAITRASRRGPLFFFFFLRFFAVARTACDKYKGVTPMGPGAKVTGFLANLLGDDDEEDVVLAATGGKALKD